MRILLVSNHTYPAHRATGNGVNPSPLPSGSGQHIHDLLALGLAELGHDVFYKLKGSASRLPKGVTLVTETPPEVDIAHGLDPQLVCEQMPGETPAVMSCHSGKNYYDIEMLADTNNWIFVSRTHAASFGSDRYVRNGIDPSTYTYCCDKGEYILFLSSMTSYKKKGLLTALALCREQNLKLIVAGSSTDKQTITEVASLCETYGATYVGDVRGRKKAELYAKARALLFPTEWDECCPLVIAEALMSGTPVIVSDNAACAEMVAPEVGFVCQSKAEYVDSLNGITTISSEVCREYAIENYHYLRMAKDYLREYDAQIQKSVL